MIFVDLAAKAQCEKPGCGKSQRVRLALNAQGTFGFGLEEQGWQMAVSKQGLYLILCPEHRQSDLVVPDKSLVLEKSH